MENCTRLPHPVAGADGVSFGMCCIVQGPETGWPGGAEEETSFCAQFSVSRDKKWQDLDFCSLPPLECLENGHGDQERSDKELGRCLFTPIPRWFDVHRKTGIGTGPTYIEVEAEMALKMRHECLF